MVKGLALRRSCFGRRLDPSERGRYADLVFFPFPVAKNSLRSSALYTVISGENGFLGLAQEHGHLSLYDLKTGTKTAEFTLPENVVYAHFSADGCRLLVVTEHQSVYILEISKLLKAFVPVDKK